MKDAEIKIGLRVTFDCKYLKKVLHGEIKEIIETPFIDAVVLFDNGMTMSVWPQNLDKE